MSSASQAESRSSWDSRSLYICSVLFSSCTGTLTIQKLVSEGMAGRGWKENRAIAAARPAVGGVDGARGKCRTPPLPPYTTLASSTRHEVRAEEEERLTKPAPSGRFSASMSVSWSWDCMGQDRGMTSTKVRISCLTSRLRIHLRRWTALRPDRGRRDYHLFAVWRSRQH